MKNHLICVNLITIGAGALIGAVGTPAWAAEAPELPYSVRTRSFSGWGTTVQGDIRTVGMAGASVGLGDSFIASGSNPAGLAMTLDSDDLNYTSNSIQDARMQSYDHPSRVDAVGGAFSLYPWGFSAGFLTPYQESGTYTIPGTAGHQARLSVWTEEFRLGAARVFLNDRMSLGMNLNFGQAFIRSEPIAPAGPVLTRRALAVGATLGTSIQLPARLIFGASIRTPIEYAASGAQGASDVQYLLSSHTRSPGVFAAGLGWIPNLYFRADVSLSVIGATPDTALLKDERIAVGDQISVQPHLGVAYSFIDLRELRATAYAGGYFEGSRVPGEIDRMHWTGGIEIKPWIFSFGWGVDVAPGYKNYLVSGSINVIRVMQKMDLIPKPWRPPYRGMMPRPTVFSDDGLPRPLVKNWHPQGPKIDVLQVGRDLPAKLQDKFENPEETLDAIRQTLEDTKDLLNEAAESAGKLVAPKKTWQDRHEGNRDRH